MQRYELGWSHKDLEKLKQTLKRTKLEASYFPTSRQLQIYTITRHECDILHILREADITKVKVDESDYSKLESSYSKEKQPIRLQRQSSECQTYHKTINSHKSFKPVVQCKAY